MTGVLEKAPPAKPPRRQTPRQAFETAIPEIPPRPPFKAREKYPLILIDKQRGKTRKIINGAQVRELFYGETREHAWFVRIDAFFDGLTYTPVLRWNADRKHASLNIPAQVYFQLDAPDSA